VAVDAVGDLIAAANDAQRLHGYMYALAQHFAVQGVTSVFPYETTTFGEVEMRLSGVADNILFLGFELQHGRGRRTIRIGKARGIDHDLDLRELRITATGIEVA
jgi:circadian clock protein KaiC